MPTYRVSLLLAVPILRIINVALLLVTIGCLISLIGAHDGIWRIGFVVVAVIALVLALAARALLHDVRRHVQYTNRPAPQDWAAETVAAQRRINARQGGPRPPVSF
jgi:membrane protein implicated in regulation of membrane protease activity